MQVCPSAREASGIQVGRGHAAGFPHASQARGNDSAKQVEQLAHLLSIQGEILSEQYPSDAAPPEGDAALPVELSEADEPEKRRGRSGWVAPAWFFLGIVVGIAAFAAYTTFLAPKPAAPAAVAAIDAAQVREAARAGVLEAIATLQAGGGQPSAQEQGPQQVSPDAIAVRDANRLGEQAAKVTVVEFSDFQ